MKLVMKPHGGSSGAADEILAVMKAVEHPNFKIWYDAGNIIYYTGKDPIEELKPIAQHVTGFCAKDCGDVKSDVMIQFGTGKVDFAGVFGVLKSAGFDGPIMVECCKVGATRRGDDGERARQPRVPRRRAGKAVRTISCAGFEVDHRVGRHPRHRKLGGAVGDHEVRQRPGPAPAHAPRRRVRAAQPDPQALDFAAAVVEQMQPRLRAVPVSRQMTTSLP